MKFSLFPYSNFIHVLDTAVLNMISDLIYENYYKINLWYCKQSTLTQIKIFHRRHMVSMIQSAVTSQHQKQTFFLPWEHGMVAEQNHYLSTQPTTRTNGKITT